MKPDAVIATNRQEENRIIGSGFKKANLLLFICQLFYMNGTKKIKVSSPNGA